MDSSDRLDVESVSPAFRKGTFATRFGAQQGFAIFATVSLLPALLTAAAALAVAFHMLKTKSLSQSVCVLNAVQLQNALKTPLEKLLALNRHARVLRVKREAADHRVQVAVLSGNPAAIATAEALQTAVILEQSKLSLQQGKWLAEATRLRESYARQMREVASRRGLGQAVTQRFFPLALAVKPEPAGSPSPDYHPVPGFEFHQQQSFSYRTNLAPPFLRAHLNSAFQQKTECSATLVEQGDVWTTRILAGSAWSNSSRRF